MTFDKFVTRSALVFMVMYLTYVNAKSLIYLIDQFQLIDRVFAIVGSMAVSMVTIIIMRRGRQKWLKLAFPAFDAAFVFCGLNVRFADNILQNPVALALSIVMAVFSGLITYSLGTITYFDSQKTDSSTDSTQLLTLKTDLGRFMTENNTLSAKLENKETELKRAKSQLEDIQTEAEKYRTVFLAAERSRILKKAEKNRTPEELEILEQTEK